MLRKELILSEKEKNYMTMKIRLECLRMSELMHHLIKNAEAKERLQETLNWMHHQIRFYQNENDLYFLIHDFNWVVSQFNELVENHSHKISPIEL